MFSIYSVFSAIRRLSNIRADFEQKYVASLYDISVLFWDHSVHNYRASFYTFYRTKIVYLSVRPASVRIFVVEELFSNRHYDYGIITRFRRFAPRKQCIRYPVRIDYTYLLLYFIYDASILQCYTIKMLIIMFRSADGYYVAVAFVPSRK